VHLAVFVEVSRFVIVKVGADGARWGPGCGASWGPPRCASHMGWAVYMPRPAARKDSISEVCLLELTNK
jgi:hypothetical protein